MNIYLVNYQKSGCYKTWCCKFWNSGGELNELITFLKKRLPDASEHDVVVFWGEIEKQYGVKPIKVCPPRPFKISDHSEDWLRHHGYIGVGKQLKDIIELGNQKNSIKNS